MEARYDNEKRLQIRITFPEMEVYGKRYDDSGRDPEIFVDKKAFFFYD